MFRCAVVGGWVNVLMHGCVGVWRINKDCHDKHQTGDESVLSAAVRQGQNCFQKEISVATSLTISFRNEKLAPK